LPTTKDRGPSSLGALVFRAGNDDLREDIEGEVEEDEDEDDKYESRLSLRSRKGST